MFATLETSSPFTLPADFLPGPEDVRFQVIERQASEKDWPFLAEKGRLACVPSFGLRVVLFMPWVEEEDGGLGGFAVEENANRTAVVSADPLQLWSDIEGKSLLQPDMTMEDKIRRMGPYVTLGKQLCDQPKGAIVGPSEL
ncbi:MAG: hypothetical protein ACRCU5_08965 [Rhizobiaceae bacterium]